MATMNIHNSRDSLTREQKSRLPQTAQGRALRTTEWFLTGKPAIRDYDRANIRTLATVA